MIREIKILIAILVFVFTSVNAQQSRLNALGGLSYSVKDIDSQLDPFDFGGNPAWISVSQKNQRLEISPSVVSDWGTYHRYFDPDGHSFYTASFSGIKPLGESGTFKGTAIYSYFVRRGNNRALVYNPYSGSSYLFTDTTAGNFRYKGPTFEFLHGLKIYKNLYFGASVEYQIYDGLKDVYTYAQTLYRNVAGKIGFAYEVNENFVLGFYYRLFDSQERIESSDVNLLTVRTFLYRGEKYRIELRSSSQDFKIKSNGKSFNFQIFVKPFPRLTVGLRSRYFVYSSRFLFPMNSLIDDEDGYSSFGISNTLLNARWTYSPKLTLGFSAGYDWNNSWSKNSKRDLTTWKWVLKDAHAGIGFSYFPTLKLMIAAEAEAHFVAADSNKYIDHISNSISSFNNVVRVGIEYFINKNSIVRMGYRFNRLAHDFVYGFEDASAHLATASFAYNISDVFQIEPQVLFSLDKDKSNKLTQRLGAFVHLRFSEF